MSSMLLLLFYLYFHLADFITFKSCPSQSILTCSIKLISSGTISINFFNGNVFTYIYSFVFILCQESFKLLLPSCLWLYNFSNPSFKDIAHGIIYIYS